LLGGPLLSRTADGIARTLPAGSRLLANGGNTRWTAPTWIHYLHAAYEPQAVDFRARISATAGRSRNLAHEAEAIGRASTVICNSRRTADDVRRAYGVHDDAMRVVYYGADPAQFGPVTEAERQAAREALGVDRDRPLALFVGALGDRRKGFDVLFEAWRSLCAEGAWDADLAVAGAGAEVDEWSRRASEQALASRMHFLKFRGDIPFVMAAADLIVHPARYEAYGLGVHEGLCRGLPAIVSACAGVAERLPFTLAPLTLPDPNAASELVERLRLWRSDMAGWKGKAETFGAELRRRTWDDMAEEIARVVEER
jgi:glycosyltransferase involved in cell wall biosynthesis